MRTLILNQSNLVQDGYNNKFVYRFPNSVFFKDDYIAVNSITMYYSWFNITAEYGNNVFQYIWNGVTYTINIPDGLYEVSQLNQLLQFTFIQNGHYLTLSGQNVYFIELVANPTRYAIQINTYLLPVVGQFTLAAGVYTGNVGTQYAGMTTSNALFFQQLIKTLNWYYQQISINYWDMLLDLQQISTIIMLMFHQLMTLMCLKIM